MNVERYVTKISAVSWI